MSDHEPEIEGRRRALRVLLRRPLVRRTAEPDDYELVRQHFEAVQAWFAQTTGWHVEHDRTGGLVRLHKVVVRVDATRPAQPEFTRRHYVLMCTLLAELDAAGRQITLQRLAEQLRDATAIEPGIETFDATQLSDRRTFVHVVRWLTEVGVLGRRDGDETRFLQGGAHGDALYDVHDRALWLLLACPRAPSSLASPEGLGEEPVGETEDAQRTARGREVYRRLLDDPVVYFDELSPDVHDWLMRSLRRVRERLEEVGLVLERRLEGVAAIDPRGELSDQPFPVANSTAAHAALKLTEWLSEVRTAPPTEVEAQVATWQEAPIGKNWRKQTAGEIARAALDLLEQHRLVEITPSRVTATPAAARFRAETP